MTRTEYAYRARVYKTKTVQKQALEDLKIIAYTVLGDSRQFIIEQAKSGETFDNYPSCKHWEKKYCRSKGTKWRGGFKFPENPNPTYYFFSDSELGLWCQLIEHMLGDPIMYPPVI